MKKTLILDLDSTLVDFCSSWLKWLFERGFSEKVHSKQEVTDYNWIQRTYGEETTNFFLEDPQRTYSSIVPFSEAQDFVYWCKRMFNVKILTHSSQKSTEDAKRKFIDRWFNCESCFFEVLEDKFLYTSNSILFDDYPLHICKHIEFNKSPGILFNHNKENGWGFIKDYNYRVDKSLYNETYTYWVTKKVLLELL